jgi:hypothetical protein
MVEGEKLGLRCPFSYQNIEWSFPDDESYFRRYQFWASKRLLFGMMQKTKDYCDT